MWDSTIFGLKLDYHLENSIPWLLLIEVCVLSHGISTVSTLPFDFLFQLAVCLIRFKQIQAYFITVCFLTLSGLGTILNVAEPRVRQLLLLDGSSSHCRVSLSLVPVLVIIMCISVIINRFGLCLFSSSKKCTGNINALISALLCPYSVLSFT